MNQRTIDRPGRRERHREEVRQRIIQAAVGLFAQHGFNDTTVEQITEAADVAKGTFFNHFEGKNGILMALVQMQRGKLLQGGQKALDPSKPTFEIVTETVYDLVQLPARSLVLFRSVLGTVLMTPPLRELFRKLLEDGLEVFKAIFERGQKRNEVRTDMSSADLARGLQSAILGAEIVWAMHDEARLSDWLDRSLALFWEGAKSQSK